MHHTCGQCLILTLGYSSSRVPESRVVQLKLKALILDIIHDISVVQCLREAQVHSVDDWTWRKQLRFYLNSDQCCIIQMVDAEFRYTYEYQVKITFSVLN